MTLFSPVSYPSRAFRAFRAFLNSSKLIDDYCKPGDIRRHENNPLVFFLSHHRSPVLPMSMQRFSCSDLREAAADGLGC